MTPHQQGRAAFDAGKPIEANPYPVEAPRDGDEYPGPYAEWRWGWLTQQAMWTHDRRRRA